MPNRSVTFDIIGNDKSKKATDSAAKGFDHLSSKAVAFGTFIGGAALGGVGALAGLAKSAISTGISTASAMQQASIGFDTLLGSAEKSKEYVAQLSKFAANTPFEFPGLVDASRLLLGVGVASNKVIPMLTDFGDAAGALSIDQDHFNNIMLATSQAISAGRFQVGDLNQLMTNGLPVWTLLSKAMGKPVPELRKMASAGQLLAKDVLPALQAEMHKDYGGAMSRQSQTLSGLWSTMQDTFSQGMAQVLTPLIPILQKSLPGAMNILGAGLTMLSGWVATGVGKFKDIYHWVDQNSGRFRSFASTVGGVVIPIVSGLVGWFMGKLIPGVRSMSAQVVPAVIGAFRSFGKTLQDHQGIVRAVVAVFKIVGMTLTQVVIPVLGFAAKTLWNVLGPAFRMIATVLDFVVIPVIKFLAKVVIAVFKGIVDGAAWAFGWVPGLGPKLKSAAKAFDKFAKDVNATLDGINDTKTVTINFKAVYHTPSGTSIPGWYGQGQGGGGSSGWNSVPSLLPKKASGGAVLANHGYIVNENGQEAFFPSTNGTIMPASRTRNLLSGGGDVHVHIHGSALGTPREIATAVVTALKSARAGGWTPPKGAFA